MEVLKFEREKCYLSKLLSPESQESFHSKLSDSVVLKYAGDDYTFGYQVIEKDDLGYLINIFMNSEIIPIRTKHSFNLLKDKIIVHHPEKLVIFQPFYYFLMDIIRPRFKCCRKSSTINPVKDDILLVLKDCSVKVSPEIINHLGSGLIASQVNEYKRISEVSELTKCQWEMLLNFIEERKWANPERSSMGKILKILCYLDAAVFDLYLGHLINYFLTKNIYTEEEILEYL